MRKKTLNKSFIENNARKKRGIYNMERRIDWSAILIRCKSKVQEKIAPLLKTLGKPQPNLGVGAGGDPIKQIDMVAENAIVDTLTKHEVSFTLISEESGVKTFGKNPDEYYVTTDPIDGTTNLMRGIHFYATSIAVSEEPILSRIQTALVADLFHGTVYTAQKGCGAYRDGRRVMPSENTLLEEAVIGVDLNSYKVERIVPRLTKLIQKTKHIRHLGANALELCYVADGTSDAFVDIRGKLRTTDIAAAWLITQEAGALMTTTKGKQLDAKLSPKEKVEFVAAANKEMHGTILELIRSEKEIE